MFVKSLWTPGAPLGWNTDENADCVIPVVALTSIIILPTKNVCDVISSGKFGSLEASANNILSNCPSLTTSYKWSFNSCPLKYQLTKYFPAVADTKSVPLS